MPLWEDNGRIPFASICRQCELENVCPNAHTVGCEFTCMSIESVCDECYSKIGCAYDKGETPDKCPLLATKH